MIFSARTNSDRRLEVNWDLVNRYTQRWKPETYLTIEIKRKHKTVSDPLRRYYFSVVLPALLKGAGYDPDEYLLIHHYLKAAFFMCEKDKRGIHRNVPSVFGNNSNIEVSRKVDYVEWCKRKAAELGEYVPDPGE